MDSNDVDSNDVAALFAQAVEISRGVTSPDDYEGVWEPLRRAAVSGQAAARLAGAQVTSPDATVRATACDLLGVISELHEEVRADAATALISLAATEVDGDVHWSIAGALGATNDARALPVLVAFAGHADADVRFQVASSLPMVMGDHADDTGVAALIELCGDPDPEVRNWATFGLGWQTTADGHVVRQALWERTMDSYGEAREEGIRGLARRRDQRALPLLAGLLAAESAHVFTFDAAAFLADPTLVPRLEQFEATDRGVAEALLECDPLRRVHRDALASSLFDALHARLPDVDIAMFSERFEVGLELEVTPRDGGHGTMRWSIEALLKGVEDDPELAVRSVADRLI